MGVIKLFSSSSYDCNKSNNETFLPNPNPNNYNVVRYLEINNYLLIQIKYLDCTNYEGNKILLYKDCKFLDLMKQKSIDPHFTNNKKYFSPVARFRPTDEDWDNAIKYINIL